MYAIRSYYDVRFAGMDLFEQRFPLLAAFRRVTINPQNTRLRETLGQHRLDPLRAAAERLDVLITADRTPLRHAALKTAMVAAQTAVGQMQHQVGRAALAARHPAALGTGEHRRVAAAVEEDSYNFV